MHQVTISFLGPINRPPGIAATSTRDIDPMSTVGALLGDLGYEPSEQSRLKVLVDGSPARLSEQLGHAMELTIFLPLGGG